MSARKAVAATPATTAVTADEAPRKTGVALDANRRPFAINGSLPEARWELMTPEQAHENAKHMRKNRKLRQPRIDSIVADIKSPGGWKLTGETVQQGDDGLWDNGNHRFEAVYKAGLAVPMLVVRGVPHDARPVIDSGQARTYHQTLAMRGVKNAYTVGSLTRRMFLWDKGEYMLAGGSKDYVPSRVELDAYREAHTEEINTAAGMQKYAGDAYMSPQVLGSLWILFHRIDKNDAALFLEQVITGAEIKVSDPAYVLRKKLVQISEEGSRGRAAEEKRAWACLAWNAFRDGRPVGKLQPPKGSGGLITNKNYPLPR
jgi:hypothetical protein